MTELSKEIVLHFESQSDKNLPIPLKPYIQSLEGIEKALGIICDYDNQNKNFKAKRISYITTAIKSQEKGSLTVDLELTLRQNELFQVDLVSVTEKFFRFSSFINNINRIPEFIRNHSSGPNRSVLQRFYQAYQLVVPQKQSDISLEIIDPQNQNSEVRLIDSDRSTLGLLQEALVEITDEVDTITVYVDSVNFKNQKVTLRFVSDDYTKSFSQKYEIEFEELLILNRRQPIKLTGVFAYDKNLMPTEVVEMHYIDAINLDPITITQFIYKERKFEFIKGSKTFPVQLDESKQHYEIIDDQYNVFVYSTQRRELIRELSESLYADWVEIALADDKELDVSAKLLKQVLLENIREIS